MQKDGQREHRTVDARDVRREPVGQEDIGDGAALSSQLLCQPRKGTAKPVARVDQALAGRDSRSGRPGTDSAANASALRLIPSSIFRAMTSDPGSIAWGEGAS